MIKAWRPFFMTIMVLLCCGGTFSALHGQPFNLAFQHLTQQKGLSQATCPFVSRDRKGFVWIGTVDGLNRYDGQKVKTYRLSPSVPNSLMDNIITSACYEDLQTGDLWFTTNSAIHRYVRAQDHFKTYQLKGKDGQTQSADYYGFHFDTNGRLWLRAGLDQDGLLHVFDTHTQQDSIYGAIQGVRINAVCGENGQVKQLICSGVIGTGVHLLNLTPHGIRDSLLQGHLIFQMFVENDTLVWLGSTNGILAFNPASKRFIQYNNLNGNTNLSCWAVFPYAQQWLFVSTDSAGLWVFDRIKRQFVQQFTHDPGNAVTLLDDECKNLLIDKEDNLWIAHWKAGLSFVNLHKNKFFIPKGIKGKAYWQFSTGYNGQVILSRPDQSILSFNTQGQVVDTFSFLDRRLKGRLKFLRKSDWPIQTQLLANSKYLFSWDKISKNIQLLDSFPAKIADFCAYSENEYMIISAKQVFWASYRAGQSMVKYPLLLKDTFVNLSVVYTDQRGFVYLGENADKLLIYKKNKQDLTLITSIPGVGYCKDFAENLASNELWVATSNGLLYIDAKHQFRVFNEGEDHIPNATYYGILLDPDGRLWLSSNNGLLHYDPVKKTSIRYGVNDGLFGPEFNTGSMYRAEDGKIWAGGLGGFVIFHPDSLKKVPYEPQVQITQLMVNDQAFETDQQVEVLDGITLPYAQNTVSLEFVALEFSDPAANQFQFRLLGYDDAWVMNGTRGFVRYANLPPGNYTFEVKAANSDGVWAQTPKRFYIRILTPFYKSWWFYLLCLLTISAIIYAWFQYRLQQVLKIERMRVQISSDLHDDVGTLLSGLAMQTEVMELTATEKDKPKLKRIGDISRDAMSRMRDTVWAIDARKDKVENLLDRMREHAEEVLTPKGILFEIVTNQVQLKTNLSTHIRQNIYLIYKEAITNIAKHSNGNKVLLTLEKTGAGLRMTILDNGAVSEKSYTTTGSGLDNMRMRAEKIGGNLEISQHSGYCITLVILNSET
jgi:signal transduction histidine kinase/streptogramin lyase